MNKIVEEAGFCVATLRDIAVKRGVDVCEVFLLGINALDALGNKTKSPMKKARKLIHAGACALEKERKTVSFAHAVEELIASKAHRRSRTVSDIRYLLGVLMRKTDRLARRKIRSLTTADCAEMIEYCFKTPRQRYKARVVLHGLFAFSFRRGWCADNPVSRVDVPVLKEKPIVALNADQCQKLIHAAKEEDQGGCLAAVGLMLYAGIRPQELQRLSWGNVNLNESVISIPATHSKTGGARHVSMEPILKNLLKGLSPEKLSSRICPKNWLRKWKAIRQSAGWTKTNPWIQDCLRHSYASFHVLYYKDFTRLQYEMGHSSPALLRTRYLNMQGLTSNMAHEFWEVA